MRFVAHTVVGIEKVALEMPRYAHRAHIRPSAVDRYRAIVEINARLGQQWLSSFDNVTSWLHSLPTNAEVWDVIFAGLHADARKLQLLDKNGLARAERLARFAPYYACSILIYEMRTAVESAVSRLQRKLLSSAPVTNITPLSQLNRPRRLASKSERRWLQSHGCHPADTCLPAVTHAMGPKRACSSY
jgi:hypothetical protein